MNATSAVKNNYVEPMQSPFMFIVIRIDRASHVAKLSQNVKFARAARSLTKYTQGCGFARVRVIRLELPSP